MRPTVALAPITVNHRRGLGKQENRRTTSRRLVIVPSPTLGGHVEPLTARKQDQHDVVTTQIRRSATTWSLVTRGEGLAARGYHVLSRCQGRRLAAGRDDLCRGWTG